MTFQKTNAKLNFPILFLPKVRWLGPARLARPNRARASSKPPEPFPDEKRMLRDFLHCYVRPCDLSPSLGALSRSLGALLRLVRHAVPGFSGSPSHAVSGSPRFSSGGSGGNGCSSNKPVSEARALHHPPSPPGCVPRFSDAWCRSGVKLCLLAVLSFALLVKIATTSLTIA